MRELTDWLDETAGPGFPTDAVVGEFHKAGKHFVAADLLRRLDRVRAELRTLVDFLDTTLDKFDGSYAYESYVAIRMLPLPGTVCPADDVDTELRRGDRLAVLLISDVLRFELTALDGDRATFPEQRPDGTTVAKRCRLGLRVVRRALDRLGLSGRLTATDPVAAARELCDLLAADQSPAETRMLKQSNLPVYVIHDEYLFIRVLQSYENAFALIAALLREAIEAIASGDAVSAARLVELADSRLQESARLFSLLATMRVESFLVFRKYTEGASAIQSRNYKAVESLCRTPDRDRTDSAAYRSVPEIRDKVLAGQATIDDVVREASANGLLDPGERGKLEDAMRAFAGALLRWRQTHYSLAVRMLGRRTGTGYTEGTPYLDAVRRIPVFEGIEQDESGHTDGGMR